MDTHARAHLDAQLRQYSLQQAAHDYKGMEKAAEVVKRAETYYEFLKLALA